MTIEEYCLKDLEVSIKLHEWSCAEKIAAIKELYEGDIEYSFSQINNKVREIVYG